MPEAHVNLISVDKIMSSGARVEFGDGTCNIVKGGKLVLTAERRDGLYSVHDSMHRTRSSKPAFVSSSTTETAELWHSRFGHLSYRSLARLVKDSMVDGITVPSSEFVSAGQSLCEPCVQAKQPRAPFPNSTSVSTRPLQLVHMDVCGPMSVASLGGSLYFATFLDDYSKVSVVVPVRTKGMVAGAVQRTLQLLETQCGHKLKAVRTDRGGEYLGGEMEAYFASKGVQHQLTAPYTPEQNGAAERLNRTLMERVRAMLIASGLGKELWAEAVLTANYIRNRSPYGKETWTPWEHFTGKKPDVSGMRVFGARAFVHTPKGLRSKLDPINQRGVFVGYSVNSKAYRVLLDGSDRVVESRDLVFDEAVVHATGDGRSRSVVLSDNEEDESQSEPMQQESVPGEVPVPPVQPGAVPDSVHDRVQARQLERTESEEAVGEQRGMPRGRGNTGSSAPETRRLPERGNRGVPPGQWYAVNLASASNEDEPATVQQALSGPDAQHWKQAMDEEMASLAENKTW